jgi:uncharacterized protein YlxW (UPF0749 family)
VTDSTDTGSSDLSQARRGRLLVVLASLLLLVGSTVIGYLFGHDIARRPLAEAQQLVKQLQPEVQQLKAKIDQQTNTIISLETKLKRTAASLHAIMPSANTYTVLANQSLTAADGRLNIGLVGAPGNNGITININGKQHSAVTGDLFNVAPDAQTSCEVRVQSFDMFSALINASCAKPQPK